MFKTRTADCLYSGCYIDFENSAFINLWLFYMQKKENIFFVVVLSNIKLKKYCDAFFYTTRTFIKALQTLYDQLTTWTSTG